MWPGEPSPGAGRKTHHKVERESQQVTEGADLLPPGPCFGRLSGLGSLVETGGEHHGATIYPHPPEGLGNLGRLRREPSQPRPAQAGAWGRADPGTLFFSVHLSLRPPLPGDSRPGQVLSQGPGLGWWPQACSMPAPGQPAEGAKGKAACCPCAGGVAPSHVREDPKDRLHPPAKMGFRNCCSLSSGTPGAGAQCPV